MWVAGGIEIKELSRKEEHKWPYAVLALLSTQVYKYTPHLAPGDEDQVEAASEEEEEDRGRHPHRTQ